MFFVQQVAFIAVQIFEKSVCSFCAMDPPKVSVIRHLGKTCNVVILDIFVS